LVADVEPGVVEDPVPLPGEDRVRGHRRAVHPELVVVPVVLDQRGSGHYRRGVVQQSHRRLSDQADTKADTTALTPAARSICVQCPQRANTLRSASGSSRTMFQLTSTGTTLSSRPCTSRVRVPVSRTCSSVMPSWLPACRSENISW